MKFGQLFIEMAIPEWKDAYLNYYLLKKIIGPLKIMAKLYIKTNFQQGREQLQLTTVLPEYMVKIKRLTDYFEEIMLGELDKINAFFQYKMMDCFKKWRIIKINMLLIDNMMIQHNVISHKMTLKNGVHQFYKEMLLIQEFVNQNNKAIKKILKKFTKSAKLLNLSNRALDQRIEQRQNNSFIQRNQTKLSQFMKEVEEEYLSFFYYHYERPNGRMELRKIVEQRLFSSTQAYYFGINFGFSIFLVGYIILMFASGQLSPDDDMLFKTAFPMFRGMALLVCAYWLTALNIYVWTKYHVNYKLILKYNYHYSQLSEILKRAAIFTTIFLLMFHWYIAIYINNKLITPALDWLPKEYTPLISWIIFLIYHFSPTRWFNFNPQGRRYLYRILKMCIWSPFRKMEFIIGYYTDQLVSYVGALKDLEYTLCYYSYELFQEDKSVCLDSSRFSSSFLVVVIPLFFRICQCARQGYDKKKFLGTTEFFNFCKYACSFMVAIFSYAQKKNSSFLVYWIITAIISTCYSYYWDLKQDWGFLQPNSYNRFLRNKLCYNNKHFYYFACIINLAMRCIWTISISPDIINKFGMRPEIVTFFIYFIECFRRCQWNFFRIEKEHVTNCGEFKAVQDIIFPLQNIAEENAADELDQLKNKEKLKSNQLESPSPVMKKHRSDNRRKSQLILQKQKDHEVSMPQEIKKKPDTSLGIPISIIEVSKDFFINTVQKQNNQFRINEILKFAKDFKEQLNKNSALQYIVKPMKLDQANDPSQIDLKKEKQQ